MGKTIGIDLGSTYLKMAYNGQVIPNREGDIVTPAIVGFHKGEIVVGRRAVDLHELTPQDTVSFIRPQIRQDTLIKLGHKEYSPVELSSLLLRKVKQDAELYLNDKAERAVIALPAYFTIEQGNTIGKAGIMAGFSMVALLDEPTAALIGSDINLNEIKTVLVYDLGGATFDISVLTIVGGKIEIISIEGNPWLGGNTFDQKIMDYVLDYIRNKFEVNARRDSRFMMVLNKEVEKAKITLSNLENTKICLSGKLQDDQVIIDVELTRKQFERMIEAEVKKTIDLVCRAMINANLTVDSIDHVLLVGGSTKIPLVQRELTGVFGKDKIRREVDPISCIARGASIQAAQFSVDNILLTKGEKLKVTDFGLAELEKAPEAWEHTNKGLSFANLGLLEEAIKEYREALRINPEYAEAHNNLGNALKAKGLLDEAIREYQEAIRLNPKYAEAYNSRGVAYYDLAQYDRAIADFDEALRLNPGFAFAYNNLGAVYGTLGQYERAISNYNEALKSNPRYSDAYNNRGNTYHKLGQYEEAIKDYDEAIRLNPKYAEAYYNRGTAYYDLGQYEHAIMDFDEALKLNPAYADEAIQLDPWYANVFKKISLEGAGSLRPVGRLQVGDIIQGRYEVQDVKMGGMGIVYLVHDHKSLTRRYTDVSFPAEVNIVKWEDLRVAIVRKEVVTPEGEVKIRPRPHEHDVEVEVEIPESPAPGEPPPPIIVNILVTAPDFEIQGDRFARIVVPLDADSEPAIFRLRAIEIGQKKITVDFIQDGRYLGVVNLEVKVIETYKVAREGNAWAESNVEIGDIYDAPDLTLLIQEFVLPDPSTELRYTLISPQNKLNLFYADFGSQVFSGSIKGWVEGMIKRIEELPGRKVSARVMEDRLTAIGNNLYDQVIPENLKNFYWANKDRIKTMVVVSDEPWIPWEIVKPYRSNETIEQEDFFCRSFSLTRWLRGSAPPVRISLNPGKILGVKAAKGRRDIFVIPKKRKKKIDLEGIAKEVEFLCSLEGRGLKVEVISPKLEEVYELLRSGQFRLFHLCSHGTYNSQSPDHSFIQLLDGTISPEDIVGKRFRDKPFVFLNVCHAARSGYSLTRIGSWASRFFEAGCSAFVGSFWSVNDELAYQFAREFYPRILDGIPLGEAFRQAREEVRKQNPSNPTWLAYCLYGDPLAKVY